MESLWKSREFTDSDLDDFRYSDSSRWTTLRTSTPFPAQGEWLTKKYIPNANVPPNDWATWLNEAVPTVNSTVNRFALAICPRALPPDGEPIADQPVAIQYLSTTKALLRTVFERMKLHRALIVLVKRGVPVISRIKCTIDGVPNCLVYTLRVDHSLSHQTAITISHIPALTTGPLPLQHGSRTHALILGYEEVDILSLTTRLKSCKENIFSPFTIIKAFLHVERERRFKEVSKKIWDFRNIMENYGKIPVGEEGILNVMGENKQDPKNLIPLYMDVCTQKNRLLAWRTQIAGFMNHVNDFKTRRGEQVDIDPREYLKSLVDEYDGRINRCDMVLQGASLAFQMETAHLSRLDARAALRDGKQMKAIALLTMVFLPGTFIATVLAVPEFEILKTTSNIAPWAWYFMMFLPLTAVVLGAYFLWINLYKSRDQKTIAAMV